MMPLEDAASSQRCDDAFQEQRKSRNNTCWRTLVHIEKNKRAQEEKGFSAWIYYRYWIWACFTSKPETKEMHCVHAKLPKEDTKIFFL